MNILIVCHYGLYQDLGDSFVHAQAAAYAALGHRVRAIVPVPLGKGGRVKPFWPIGCHTHAEDGVEICDLRFVSLSNWGVENGFNRESALCAIRMEYRKLLRDFHPDVIHAHTIGFDSEVGAWFREKLEVPLVVTTHGSDTFVPIREGKQALLVDCSKKVDYIVCVSSLLKNALLSCGVKTKMSVILNGFRVENIPQNYDKVSTKWIQIGSLIEQKKVDVNIRAFAAFYERYPQATLTIVGSGPDREALEELCRDLGVQDAVRFTGQLSNREALSELGKAQFFVMPSVREGFGIVYLEAMASGCITIGTEGEGIADLIQDGVNGFLVPPDDSAAIVEQVEYCLERPELARRIVQQGVLDASDLTWTKNAKCYLSLFKSLIEGANQS